MNTCAGSPSAPNSIRTDAKARLHCPDGPALRYRDGWSAHVWKGVQVPAWTIEHPERITRSILANTCEPVLRNCMIEIMTPERFIASGAPARVAEDETGVLWRKLRGFRGVTVGSWTAVEVVNGTPEADGPRKHYFLRVPSPTHRAGGRCLDLWAHRETIRGPPAQDLSRVCARLCANIWSVCE